MHSTISFILVLTSWSVHHDDHLWHDGDPYDNKANDFGKHILLTTTEHSLGNLYLNFLLFAGLNDHVIHHLFPTIDHSRFDEIRDIFIQTKKEFGIETKSHSFFMLWRGVLRRLVQSGTVMTE